MTTTSAVTETAVEAPSYGAAVRASRKRHGRGHQRRRWDVGGASKAALRKWLDENKGDTQGSLEQTTFRHFRLHQTYQDKTCRVAFVFTDEQLRAVTLKALEQVGAECESGAAPPGPLADELAEWTDALE